MTSRLDVASAFETIVASCGALLSSGGFVRRGGVLRKIVDGNAALIEFQKSAGNHRDLLRFTVNVGVVSGQLLDPEGPSVTESKIMHAHLRERIGRFQPEPADKWWVIEPGADLEAIAADVSGLLINRAVPFLEQHSRTENLVQMWRSGVSPGLTRTQRVRYLGQLATPVPGDEGPTRQT